MIPQQPQNNVTLPTLSLPKGGGALTGIRQNIDTVGVTGQGGLTIPLPLSPGRGHDPALALQYGSQNGQSAFGQGWDLPLPAFTLRTHFGTPRYDGNDPLLAPNGEVLIAECDAYGLPITYRATHLMGVALPVEKEWQVESWMLRVITDSTRYERWTPVHEGKQGVPFWVVRSPDGSVGIYGYSSQARLADPAQPDHIASWLLEESVTPTGEHIYYQYCAENDTHLTEADLLRDHRAQRYLQRVCYGNLQAEALPFLFTETLSDAWMFELWLDYGEYAFDTHTLPVWQQPVASWARRITPHSNWQFGFEIRTLRLCRQAILFHRFAELGEKPQAVARLRLHYTESSTQTLLSEVDQVGHQVAGETLTLPAIRYDYSRFSPDTSRKQWHSLIRLTEVCDTHHFQWVDLWGEGLPGILYQSVDGWRYRAPIRDLTQGENGVGYGPEQPLPSQPVAINQPAPLLTDMTGDGHLDWVITLPGVAGFFTATRTGEWSTFIPWRAFPVEFTHPDRQLAALGGYLSDLTLIGPQSVRLYSNQRGTFAPPKDVPYAGDLPLFNTSPLELVAFSDVLGSGHPHLVRVRHDGIECWPNLGHGQFGKVLRLATLPYTVERFNPAQVRLVDLDGSGAADLIVAHSDYLEIYLNLAGNGFATTPLRVNLPEGERFDSLSKLDFADLTGSGFASVTLTQMHPQPRHYRLDLSAEKPWLLVTINDPVGCSTTWQYRSSAQEWLDEKAENPDKPCHLPFALQVVKRVITEDRVSGNQLTQTKTYRDAWYDGHEREFNGFSHIIQADSESAGPLARQHHYSAPLVKHSFFHTGYALNMTMTASWYDPDAPVLGENLLMQRNTRGDTPCDVTSLDTASLHSVNRALKGMLLREEIFAIDHAVPYSISEQRYALRLWQPAGQQDYAAIQPLPLESRDWSYDQVADDPQAQHQLLLQWDEWGQPLKQAVVSYPRRPSPTNPYAADTPHALWWQESFDDQQSFWQLQVSQQSWLSRLDNGWWRMGLAEQSTAHTLSIPSQDHAVSQGISYEALIAADGWLSDSRYPHALLSWNRMTWMNDEQDRPLAAGLLRYSHTAELDDEALHAWKGWLEGAELDKALNAAHYQAGQPGEPRWLLQSPSSFYGDFSQFYRLQSQQANRWQPPGEIRWDNHHLLVTTVTDPVGLITHAEYDYRLLKPRLLVDAQGTQHEAAYDALGRLRGITFYGIEADQPVGFGPLAQHTFIASDFATALNDPATALGKLESLCFYAPENMQDNGRPVYSAVISADRYPDDQDRQIRITLVYSDGFGRELQSKTKVEPGLALYTDETGKIVVDNHEPVQSPTEDRWRVTARVEYNNKGEPVRQYQPYFITGWHYISDENLRETGWYSALWYDAAGRVVDVLDGMWNWTHHGWHPWYQVVEDANDTAELPRPAWLIGCPKGKPKSTYHRT